MTSVSNDATLSQGDQSVENTNQPEVIDEQTEEEDPIIIWDKRFKTVSVSHLFLPF